MRDTQMKIRKSYNKSTADNFIDGIFDMCIGIFKILKFVTIKFYLVCVSIGEKIMEYFDKKNGKR